MFGDRCARNSLSKLIVGRAGASGRPFHLIVDFEFASQASKAIMTSMMDPRTIHTQAGAF